MIFPSSVAWLRSEGAKLDVPLRRRILGHYRPPGWLPCWFHGLWVRLVSQFVKIPVIVYVEGECGPARSDLLKHGCSVQHVLPELGCISATARIRALRALCHCDRIRRVWLDGEVRACLDTAVVSARAVKTVSMYTGRGVTIAVVDTGIYPHPDLAGRIVAFADMVGGRKEPYDDNGHGTHVAGCAAGSGSMSEGRYRGPAPEASLIGVKVLNKVGSGRTSSLLAGIDWVIRHREQYGIRIISMSLGAPVRTRCSEDPLCEAVSRAWDAGIVVVAAAGNDGPEPESVSSPGINPKVITVGAMDDVGSADRADDALAAFSSRGPTPEGQHKPDVLAPGVRIVSLRAPGSFVDKMQPEARVGRWYLELSGTSMATPNDAVAL